MSAVVNVSKAGAVAVIRIDRPPVNAINAQMGRELDAACEQIESDAGVRAAVIWGGEKTFSAGADLKEMAAGTGQDVMARIRVLQRVIDRIEALPVVTIAAITGYAFGGGCEITLACDFRLAASRARLGQPEIAVGLIPGAGGTQRLPRLIGVARAKKVVLGGEPVPAAQALDWGLVDEVVEGDVLERAVEMASRYASGPTLSLAAAKRAIDRGMDTDLRVGLELELEAFSSLFQTRDTRHGLESFATEGPGKAKFEGR
jgi:enoyl-CoA hydratase/carnithine racemase